MRNLFKRWFSWFIAAFIATGVISLLSDAAVCGDAPSAAIPSYSSVNPGSVQEGELPSGNRQARIVDRSYRLLPLSNSPVRRILTPRSRSEETAIVPEFRAWRISESVRFCNKNADIHIFLKHLHHALPVRAGPIVA